MSDWAELPKGHYAAPIVDQADTRLGYRLFERFTRRGAQRFAFGTVVALPGREDELAAATPDTATYFRTRLQADVETLTSDPDRFRLLFGTFVGKCGWCGRKLTDPNSRLVGIGPDCRSGLGWTLDDVSKVMAEPANEVGHFVGSGPGTERRAPDTL